jgi:hypothetical protein
MFKKILAKFQKKKNEEPKGEEVLLSRIDKHMNFILRDRLGFVNKTINSKILDIAKGKDDVMLSLRNLHKSKLLNTNIPEREVQIMDGNRDNYIKKVSHFTSSIDVPKTYLDTYDYCVTFSKELEQLNRDVQKNIFVLQHFFSNEVKESNRALHSLEEAIIDIRVLLEKNGITNLKEIQRDITLFMENVTKMKSFKEQIDAENSELQIHKEKKDRLDERIKTISNSTDYRALEGFQQDKGAAENSIKQTLTEITAHFSILEFALRKYYYKYPDKKIIKTYLEDLKQALIHDKNLEITQLLLELNKSIESDELELKDRKKEHCIEAISKLTFEFLKESQATILKLEDQKQHAQSKITHNSASLNLSEQQYWVNATEDKIKYHLNNIERLDKNISTIKLDNDKIITDLKTELEKLMDRDIILKDDLTTKILSGKPITIEDNSN